MSDLQPGPELDALVAEKVMGMTYIEYPEIREQWDDLIKEHGYTGLHEKFYTDKGATIDDEMACPEFSSSIAAAWEVIEKLAWREPEVTKDDRGYTVFLLGGYFADAKTAPHAIALAALKAVGCES